MTDFVNITAPLHSRRYDSLDPIDGVNVDDLDIIGATDAEDGHGDKIPDPSIDLHVLSRSRRIHGQGLAVGRMDTRGLPYFR